MYLSEVNGTTSKKLRFESKCFLLHISFAENLREDGYNSTRDGNNTT